MDKTKRPVSWYGYREVSKDGDNMYIGKIIELPDSLAKYQFQIAEVEFNSINN